MHAAWSTSRCGQVCVPRPVPYAPRAKAKSWFSGIVTARIRCSRRCTTQQKMYDTVSDPAWVAAPGPYSRSHESGRSVDVTLASPRPNCARDRRVGGRYCLVDMGTGFDSFTPQATAYATDGVSPAARAARTRLRTAMATGGLRVYTGEWWHFDGPGADVQRPIIDVPPI